MLRHDLEARYICSCTVQICRIHTLSKLRELESKLVKKTAYVVKIGHKDDSTQWGFDTFLPYLCSHAWLSVKPAVNESRRAMFWVGGLAHW